MTQPVPPSVADSKLHQFLQHPKLTQCHSLSSEQLFAHTAELPIKMITSAAGPYLERYFLVEENGCFAYLHRFVNEDARDEGVHDHPWQLAYSQVLHGGYTQQVNAGAVMPGHTLLLNEQRIQAGDTNLIAGTRFHKITQVDNETWTLFVHSEWCRPWGFLHGDLGTGEFEHQVHPSDPDHRWWPHAPLAKNSNREPFVDAQLVA